MNSEELISFPKYIDLFTFIRQQYSQSKFLLTVIVIVLFKDQYEV